MEFLALLGLGLALLLLWLVLRPRPVRVVRLGGRWWRVVPLLAVLVLSGCVSLRRHRQEVRELEHVLAEHNRLGSQVVATCRERERGLLQRIDEMEFEKDSLAAQLADLEERYRKCGGWIKKKTEIRAVPAPHIEEAYDFDAAGGRAARRTNEELRQDLEKLVPSTEDVQRLVPR